MAFTIISQGTYTSTGAEKNINCPSDVDYFVTQNLTQSATAPGGSAVVCTKGEWISGGNYLPGDGLRTYKVITNALLQNNFSDASGGAAAVGGFTFYSSYPQPGAPVTGSGITNANPAVVTVTNTFSEGNIVVLYNTTGMLQIGGMPFTISSVSGSGFTLLGLAAGSFATAATAVTARLLAQEAPVEPACLYVTAISLDARAVVTSSIANSYVLGQKVYFSVPASYGMTQIDTLTGTITAVSGTTVPINGAPGALSAYQFQVNIDSSAFTAFAFPASTSSPAARLFASVSPAGSSTQYNPVTGVQTGYNFSYVPFHSGLFTPYMAIAGGAQSPGGSNGDKILYQIYKMEQTVYN